MTTTINASTSSGLAITPDNSGNIMLQYNGVSTPAFFAALTGSDQTSVPLATYTKIALNTKVFDTAGYFDTTNYRYLPLVAGYYQVNWTSYMSLGVASASMRAYLFKNGANYCSGNWMYNPSNQTDIVANGSTMVYLNGSTDYIDVRVWIQSGSGTGTLYAGTAPYWSNLNGFLVRGA